MKGTTVIQEGKHIFCLMNDDGLEPHRPCNILLVFGPVRAKNMDFCDAINSQKNDEEIERLRIKNERKRE